MLWSTAMRHLGPHDGAIITQTWCGMQIRIPYSQCSDKRFRLVNHQGEEVGQVALPSMPFDAEAITRMLYETGCPPTGWVPGREHFCSPYYKPDILYAILTTVRQLVQENNQVEISVAALRARGGIKERTFTLHLLNLIEDGQGLLALDEPRTVVRLATWREAMQASARIIESMRNRAKGDRILPECKLGLQESSTLCDWKIITRSEQPFLCFPLNDSYGSVVGDASVIDRHLQEYTLPGGWAATYGNNESERERYQRELERRQIY